MGEKTKAPTELKVKASTLAAYAGSTVALAVLNGVSADASVISGMPDWLEALLLPAVPALAAFVAGWRARHTHRPDLRSDRVIRRPVD